MGTIQSFAYCFSRLQVSSECRLDDNFKKGSCSGGYPCVAQLTTRISNVGITKMFLRLRTGFRILQLREAKYTVTLVTDQETRTPEEEDYVPWKLCVAFDHGSRVLAECHDHPTAGHLGIRKTIARISQRYYWPGLFRDVARYVKQCEKCQKFKVSQLKPAGRMLTRQVEEPFGTLCADFVGPLPRSKHGNTMLLVFFDAFTKWVELIPLRKATSAHLERAFREAILSSTWPTDPTSLPRPRGSSWESVRDTEDSTHGRPIGRPQDADYIVHSPYNSEQSRATPPNAGGGDMEAFHGADADWGSDEEGRPQRLPDSSAKAQRTSTYRCWGTMSTSRHWPRPET
ncbi:hypothetical protein ACLKA6_007527 [Drosophila palustris]